ncbi:MAG: hypothetical protein IK086_02770, partial [Clostridia bacterium]|nr:hypothetical protein [Clostridia bacterium]
QINGSTATYTDKMVCIESTNNKSSAFITVNLNGFDGGTKQWFKFTCKVKCIGDSDPVVSTLYNKYTGNQCETTQPDSNDGDMAVIESSYDSATGILTGYIKAWVPTYNKAARYPYIRYNPVSGANVAIVVGNGRYIGNGYTDQALDTSFAIASPTLYKIDWYGAADTLASAKEADEIGDNLIAPISDKTVDFSTNWNMTWTASNNPLTAPMGYWHKLAVESNNVTCIDIPEGFFESDDVDGDPKMLRLAGANAASGTASATNQQALNIETHLEANKTYQFDLDYRAFGGAEAYINIQTAAEGGSYSSSLVTYTNTSSNVDGAHRSVRFTMPSNARSTNNFKVYVGQKYPLKATGTVYLANASLREVSGNSLGGNLFLNGDFHKGLPGNVTSGSAPTVFYGWGQVDVLNYPSVTLMPIPSGFFSGTAVSGDNTIALKATGGNYVEVQFRVELKPNTYYKLQFDYRNIGDLPKLDYQANGTVTITKISDNSDGKYRMTYQIYSDGTNTAAANGAAGNTRIRFKFGASSSGKTAYINNVKLFELTGSNGSTVGSNMVGNLNAVYDESYYSQLGEDTGDTLDVTLTQDVNTNVKRNLANSWFGASSGSSSITQQLVRVPGDFFNYLDYGERIVLIRKTLLGLKTSDGINPHYNPNNDEEWGDVKDLVYAKNAAIASANAPEQKQITINGNPLSEYVFFNDGAADNAVSAVDTVLEEYLETDVDLSTASKMPTSGKAIRIASDNAVSPGKCRVTVTSNTLNITAYRKEFTPQAIDGFASLLSGNSVNLASGLSREFNIATEAYSSGSDKRIIGGSTANSIGYTCGQTATIRVAAVSLSDAKILTGVPYYKINIFNETTGGTTSEQYVTPTNGVYEFTVTSGSTPGYIFWSAIACDSNKNRITAFSTVDSDNRNFAGSVGFNVSSLTAKSAKPSDFNTYWQNVASGITATGYTVTSVAANSGYNAYLVKIPCGTDINGNQGYATGYLTVPSNASASNKIKLKLKFQSYSVTAPGKLYEANTAYFHVCAHSMDISSSSNSSISAVSAYRDQYGLNYDASTIEQTYYYQMIRRDLTAGKFMLDYFGSSGNNYWNGTDFEATGGSMGGFQSTAVAALLKYTNSAGKGINYLNIEIPYMCDLNGTGNGRLTRTWGTKYTDRLKYFDTTYFGSMVTCKTRIFAGLGDTICPASGTTVLYNTIPASDKQITYRQGATHNEYGSGAVFTKTP